MTRTVNQNGERISRDIRKETITRDRVGAEPETAWGRNVWFGSGCVTNIRRYYYRTRMHAVQGDISDDIGKGGRVA